ncbi:MAG: prolyl oligopeptidase family serine peptidase [Planctomycetaceae bacterium]|jgi:predicted peptidase|nr:prolyl oligopeptidase family serine peptidase [Planctomycetaceae bacterium]
MKKRTCFLLIVLMMNFCFPFAQGEESVKPETGKQIAAKMTVPKSRSVWNTERGYGNLSETLQTPVPTDDSEKEELQYFLFLPENYNTEEKKTFPLLLFLHGAGERGDDLEKVKFHGPPKLLAANEELRKRCPFIVVSPQCRENHYWSPAQLLFFLDQLETNHRVDKNRVYVTGLSMGGFGTWMLTAYAGDRFAAAAPVCGGLNPVNADKLVNMPIWAFHGESDPTVPVKSTIDAVEAVKKLGGEKIKMTLYPNVGHDSWTQTYDNLELYKWFLGYKRTEKSAP